MLDNASFVSSYSLQSNLGTRLQEEGVIVLKRSSLYGPLGSVADYCPLTPRHRLRTSTTAVWMNGWQQIHSSVRYHEPLTLPLPTPIASLSFGLTCTVTA